MSNQIFSNQTEIYPFLKFASGLQEKNGDIIQLNTNNVNRGSSLVITDNSGDGSYANPYIANFIQNPRVSQDSANVPAGAGTTTTLSTIPFVGLLTGNYMFETYLTLENGAVGTDQYYTILSYYQIDANPAVNYNINNRVLTVADSGTRNQFYTRFVITSPANGTDIQISCAYSSAATATATKNIFNVILTYLG